MREFHISRQSRDLYGFDQSLFSLSGNVIFVNFHAVRIFAQKMNARRDLIHFPERAVRAGQINAMGLIDEIIHYIAGLYRQQVNPLAMQQALEWLDKELSRETVDQTLTAFCTDFPPLAVYRRELSVSAYLDGETDGESNRAIALEELVLLWLANSNPAMSPYRELFDDSDLDTITGYAQVMDQLHTFFDTQPPFGPDRQNLIDMLRAPAISVPYSLTGQLEYMREHWRELLGRYLYRLLASLDLLKEEERMAFAGPGPSLPPTYDLARLEPERFSPDRDWMPRVVILAKNAYVWLDQLARKYNRPINRLDQIPDEELDQLMQWGFTGLWLIGVWERSHASETIKRLCGNPDAVASAYSLKGYDIATDLGGYEAYRNLRDRAWQRGIRLTSDMVPNHMGIDSPWVLEHPDWFISLDYSPFPSYSFNGPNLSPDPNVSIYIEDHYYDRSDAAVVFKRVDRRNGQEKFIYHGNDGTSMPWNDTAQLNYLNPEVREAVIQTILHVARQFSIIRFDAAMTLAKKHYQRLWYPEPGSGGAIPSRSGFGMSREQFDAQISVEFWREVVDRVAQEAPDTLLLAEAFWLMEGYFVRTLGMHRVYNSAFMNMLRNEDNANYRLVMKNTLEFDPEILKRYVNFMNNPDERTAVDQFGKGDKYFGICTMMVTLPGLPMFGHGQVEGFAEKYGMEFHRAYWDETPDSGLIERHERQIFPLLHRRHIFSGVENFLLYDFFTPEGYVNEDVFAYSNGEGNERALVVYHNKFASTRGWVRTSVGYLQKDAHGKHLVQKSLVEGLGLHPDDNHFVLFRNHLNGLEYIRSCKDMAEHGLFVELDAYKAQVFLDFREVVDDEWGQYAQLNAYLNGRGVPEIRETLQELFLRPVHHPFRELVNPDMFNRLMQARLSADDGEIDEHLLDEIEGKMLNLLREARRFAHGEENEQPVAREVRHEIAAILALPALGSHYPLPGAKHYNAAVKSFLSHLGKEPSKWICMFAWAILHGLGKVVQADDSEEISRSWIDEWLLGRILAGVAQQMGQDEPSAWRIVATVNLLTRQQGWFSGKIAQTPGQILSAWLEDSEIQSYLGINRYQDVLWYNKESFENLLEWMMFLAVVGVSGNPELSASQVVEQIVAFHNVIGKIRLAGSRSAYQVEKLLEAVAD
jgi:glycosidase